MGRREASEMQAIIDAIRDDVEKAKKRDVVVLSANELAREYGIHPNTAASILRTMGLEYDGVFWYFVEGE